MNELKLLLFVVLFVISALSFTSLAWAVNVSTDKLLYNFGESMNVIGNVSPVQDGQFIILQITNPGQTDIVTVDQFLPASDGSFSKTYQAGGTKWNLDGVYTLKIFYGEWYETTFEFKSESSTKSNAKESTYESKSSDTNQNVDVESKSSNIQKTKILKFLDIAKSPSYYFERYENEPEYKKWFEGVFPNSSIEEVIGYQSTRVPGFPDNAKSPTYYVNRYNDDQSYQEWFDENFPDASIYDILGFPKSSFRIVPEWIKNNAGWWADDQIDDGSFVAGIQYLINERIIKVSSTSQGNESVGEIPPWIKNNAGWWADGLITDSEFIKAVEFLVEDGIITIN